MVRYIADSPAVFQVVAAHALHGDVQTHSEAQPQFVVLGKLPGRAGAAVDLQTGFGQGDQIETQIQVEDGGRTVAQPEVQAGREDTLVKDRPEFTLDSQKDMVSVAMDPDPGSESSCAVGGSGQKHQGQNQ